MSSLGLTRAGAGILPVLQRAWGEKVQEIAQTHEDKIEALDEVARGVAAGVVAGFDRVRLPLLVAVASLGVGAVALVGLFVVQLLALFRPVAEVLR